MSLTCECHWLCHPPQKKIKSLTCTIKLNHILSALQRPCEHSACSKHYWVLLSLLFMFSSSRSHPFSLQNTTSCFSWHFKHTAIMWNIFQMFLLCCIFLSPQEEHIHTIVTPCCLKSTSFSVQVLRFSTAFFSFSRCPLYNNSMYLIF